MTDNRLTPQDLEAERSTLGGMMLSEDAIADVIEIIQGRDFYKPAHEMVYNAITDLFAKGEPVDTITLTDELRSRDELSRVGGPTYVQELIAATPSAASATFYAKIVHDKAIMRRLVEAGTRISQLGYTPDVETDQAVDRAQAEIYSVNEGNSGQDYITVGEAFEETLEYIEDLGKSGGASGIPTGFIDLDEVTHGLQGGQMIVIAARPGMGKSTLAIDFARHAALRKKQPTLFFTLEMDWKEIMSRIISAETKTPLQDIRTGRVGEEQWVKIADLTQTMHDSPLIIDDSPNLTLMEIRAKCRRVKQQKGLNMVIIDYLQLMTSGAKVESRQQEVSEFSRSLKLLAKELDVPVIALSQLNRKAEERSDKKPAISDLRESGSIEQDADMVMLLHRPDVADKESERAGEADLILAKHRNGPTAEIVLAFQGKYSRFANLSKNFG